MQTSWNLKDSGLHRADSKETFGPIGRPKGTHAFHEDVADESLVKKLTFAAQKNERQKIVDASLKSHGTAKLRDVVAEVREAKHHVEEVRKQCEAERRAKDAELNTIHSQVEEMKERLHNAQSGAVVTVLQGLSVDSSSEEEEDVQNMIDPKRAMKRSPTRKKTGLVLIECKGCRNKLHASHKYCIQCGRTKNADTSGTHAFHADKDMEYEIKMAAIKQEDIENELYKVKLQLETAAALEEHQAFLLEKAEEEMVAAKAALTNQVAEFQEIEAEALCLRTDAEDKAARLQKTEDIIASLKGQVQTEDAAMPAMPSWYANTSLMAQPAVGETML